MPRRNRPPCRRVASADCSSGWEGGGDSGAIDRENLKTLVVVGIRNRQSINERVSVDHSYLVLLT